jgi:hypothetical protein
MPATTTPTRDDPTRIVPAAFPVGVGATVEVTAAEAEVLDEAALALLELMDEAAVTIPVDVLAVEAATIIPPAAVAAVGAAVVEEAPESESEPESGINSVA